jgi:glucose-6-phosphate isomerase
VPRPAPPRLRDAHLGGDAAAVAARLRRLGRDRFVERLFAADPSPWSDDAAVRRLIRRRLGWPGAPARYLQEVPALERFTRRALDAGIRHVVLLGMGGSSLGPEVFRRVFGTRTGFPDLTVLDTTVPSALRRVETNRDLTRTLFLVSSKSGTTSETAALEAYFWGRLRRLMGRDAPQRFAAITDPGTPLAARAAERQYFGAFHNPEEIGGRFSALSYFGLVPAALLGIDLRGFLGRAIEMGRRCGAGVPPTDNPALVLGAALGVLARRGRDKVILLADGPLDGFGLWIEQLVAESTGKIGRGLVPVVAEDLGTWRGLLRGGDRVGVAMTVAGGATARRLDAGPPGRTAGIRGGPFHGAPVLGLPLRDRLDLGGAMLLWEIATAAAGAILGVNPFDEPDVASAKTATESILAGRDDGAPSRDTTVDTGRAVLRLAPPLAGKGRAIAARLLKEFTRRIRKGDHLALLAWVDPLDPALERELRRLRDVLAQRTGVPVAWACGPRYLHSTGQLHKGGPDTAVLLQFVAGDATRLDIPGKPYDFETLKQAQALGDYRTLVARGRRVLRIEAAGPAAAALAALRRELSSGGGRRGGR